MKFPWPKTCGLIIRAVCIKGAAIKIMARSLLLARNEIAKTATRLTLQSPQGQVQHMFNVARFDQMFDIVENRLK